MTVHLEAAAQFDTEARLTELPEPIERDVYSIRCVERRTDILEILRVTREELAAASTQDELLNATQNALAKVMLLFTSPTFNKSGKLPREFREFHIANAAIYALRKAVLVRIQEASATSRNTSEHSLGESRTLSFVAA